MKITRFLEFVEDDFNPIKSFYIKDELNPKVWNDFTIDVNIQQDLLKIAQDFYSYCDLEAEIKDVILVGSLANYNWSEEYSDFDLHIVVDLKEINPEVDFVKKYTDAVKKLWNSLHDLKIRGYEVELHIQGTEDVLKSTGIYSLKNGKWLSKPSKINFTPDEDEIRKKASRVMLFIDDLEETIEDAKDDYSEFNERIRKIWNKIKDFRKNGLEEGGEFSTGNLIFKLLRRNGYIDKLITIKKKAYDSQFK